MFAPTKLPSPPSPKALTPSTSEESLPLTTSESPAGAKAVPDAVLAAARARQADLGRFPRIRLGHLPTPLEHCPRLSEALGGVQVYVKRDDCTGLATGGNKTRKLGEGSTCAGAYLVRLSLLCVCYCCPSASAAAEPSRTTSKRGLRLKPRHCSHSEWLMADALESGADYVMTHGATQSNHARQTAAAAAKLGLKCHILLEDRTRSTDPDYLRNGNVFLDDLFGATRETRPPGLDMHAEMMSVAERYRTERGASVYAIHGGGSNSVGALGYVDCFYETIQQVRERDVDVDALVFATGSAGTHAGLVAGARACGSDVRLLGFGVRKPKAAQEAAVLGLAERVAEKIGVPGAVAAADVEADCAYIGEGYGIPGEDTVEAIRMFAELEGLLLDPVYSGKAAAGLIDYCRKGRFQKGENVVFLHTGGQVSHGFFVF